MHSEIIVTDTYKHIDTFVEDDLWGKMTYGGRGPSVEDNLWWKMTFGGRQPSVEDDLRWILTCCFAAFSYSLLDITILIDYKMTKK